MKDTAKKPILVIMAAGMGSRFGGLKQIEAVGPAGEAILDYSLFDAHRAGFETVVFIIKHAIEDAFKSTVGARAEKAGLNVRYAYQELDILPEGFTVPEGRIKPWGTAHAILSAADVIDAPFAVINADDYYGRTCFELIYNYLSAGHAGPKYPWVMVGYLLGNTVSTNGSVSRGVCVTDADGNLDTVTERTRIETYDSGIHYTEDGGETWVDLPADTVVSMFLYRTVTGQYYYRTIPSFSRTICGFLLAVGVAVIGVVFAHNFIIKFVLTAAILFIYCNIYRAQLYKLWQIFMGFVRRYLLHSQA